jgi:hypothetical protein
MRTFLCLLPVAVVALLAAACNSPTSPSAPSFAIDFARGPQGWTGGFSDYGTYLDRIEATFVSDYRPLPAALAPSQSALYVSASNYSENLSMFFKGKVTGLRPNATYDASFTTQIATDTSYGCVGIGAPPGEAVYVKAGAFADEPVAIVVGDQVQMNLDKGNRWYGGSDMTVLGNVANSVPCQGAPGGGVLYVWEFKNLASESRALHVRAAADGSIWLIVGFDSSFGGWQELYVTKFGVTFEKAQ